MPELTFAGRVSEELRQTVVLRDEVLGRIDKIKTDKLPGPYGIHWRVLKEPLKGEIAGSSNKKM